MNGYLQETKANNGIYKPKTLILNFAISYFGLSKSQDDIIPDLDANEQPKYQLNKMLPASFSNATMKVNWVKVWEFNPNSISLTNKAPYIINPLNDVHNKYIVNNHTFHKKITSIRWQVNNNLYNNSNHYCKIDYGLSPTSLNHTINNIPQISADHLYSVTLNNLTPNQVYYYKVSVNGLSSSQPFPAVHSFRAAPADDATTTKFYAYGDTRSTPQDHNAVCGQMLNEITADPTSNTLLLHVGDWNAADNESNWENEYFNISSTNANNLRSSIALMGVKGNHEKVGNHFRKYFPFPYKTDLLSGNKWSYSYDYGPVHFTVLDIEASDSGQDGWKTNFSQQEVDWIDWDLSHTDKKWKVLLFHAHVNTLHATTIPTSMVNIVKQKAKQYGVQLVLMGHEHYYAHWVEEGTHYMILGGGGAGNDGVKQALCQSSDELYVATQLHFAKFDVQGDIMKVDVIQAISNSNYQAGRRIEKFSIPIATDITTNYNYNNPVDYPITTDVLTIKSGGVLTVNSSINMAKAGQITVEKGGKLIIDGANALVSNKSRGQEFIKFLDASDGYYTEPDNLWKGILVQGDPYYDQSDETKQGVLEMKNGATIKNAEVAVCVGNSFLANSSNNYGNGIIKIIDAKFINNQFDILMRPNVFSMVGVTPINFDYHSYITHSKFENNSNMLIDPIGIGKRGNIYLNGIISIDILGNTFENLDNSLAVQEIGTAIMAINSSLNVTPYYDPLITPPSIIAKNKFKNLFKGVYVYNGLGGDGLVKINKNVFTNTYHSIFTSGTNNLEILQDSINVPNQAPTQAGQSVPERPYGIYLNGGKGFKVEENTLYRPSSNGAAAFNGARGIIVHKTGAVNNEIYKNTLNNLFLSEQAQCYNSGTNLPPWAGTNNPGAKTGLKFFCNTSQTDAASYDMWMGGMGYCDNIPSSLIGAHRFGIAMFQKQANPSDPQNRFLPAGNQFSTSHLSLPTTATVDFDNGQAGWLEYSWDDLDGNGPDGWDPVRKDNITNQVIQVSFDVCPSKIINGGNGGSSTQLYANLNTAPIALNSSITLLNIWRDGGNANLDQQVETTQPWDVYQQFNSLLAESPYLSDEVLIEVIQNPAFTSLMVKLLMIANPHAVHSDAVMYELENRLPAMPQSYIDEIKSQPETTSQLQVLESNVAADNHLVSMISEDIKRMYRADNTNAWAKDSLIAFVSRRPGLYDKYELATIYLSYGQYSDMSTVLSYIDNNFELEEELQTDYTSFVSLMNIAQNMQENILYEEGLSEAQRTSLETILTDDRPLIAPIALALLKRDNPKYVYNEAVYDVPQSSPRLAAPMHNNASVASNTDFKLYPNPARDYTTLQYNCQFNNLTYSVIDISGREIKKGSLKTIESSKTNEVLINLGGISPDTYYFVIKTNDLSLFTEKLVIAK